MIAPPKDLLEIVDAINTMYAWHGGMSSPFYSFASTRTIHSEDHRYHCMNEVKKCMAISHDLDELANLSSVEALVVHAEIKKEVCSRQDWERLS